LDDFGETDFKVDLFNEIEKAYGVGELNIWYFLTRWWSYCILSLYKVWQSNKS
jgi:hypothetical protein